MFILLARWRGKVAEPENPKNLRGWGVGGSLEVVLHLMKGQVAFRTLREGGKFVISSQFFLE